MKNGSLYGLVLSACLALGGCSGGAGSLLGSSGGGDCSPKTATLNFPSTGSYSASGGLGAAQGCFTTTNFTTRASTSPIVSAYVNGASSAHTYLYLDVTFDNTQYATGLPSLAITVPASILVAGRTFYIASNLTGGYSFSWNAAAEGPGSVSGTTINFSGGGGNTTYLGGQPVELALYSVGP